MAPELLIFDLDGTLVDSFRAIHASLVHAMTTLGYEPWDFARTRPRVGWGLEHLMREAMGEANVTTGIRYFREQYPQVCLPLTEILPTVETTLSRLRSRGYTMAVATNKPSTFSRQILAHLEIEHYFQSVLGPNDVPRPKPHPDMLESIMERAGKGPEHCLYIGDMPLDVETAKAAEVPVLLVATGSYSYEELKASGVPVIERLDAILTFLDQCLHSAKQPFKEDDR